MTSQTFTFVSDSSDSDSQDSDDQSALLKKHETNKGAGHSRKQVKYKTEVRKDENENNNRKPKIPPCSPPNGVLKKLKKTKIKSVKDGMKQLEKHELEKKRRTILYQLMVTSAIAMLHGLSVLPYFWYTIFLNVHELKTQTISMWCLLVAYILSYAISPFIIQRLSLKWTLSIGSIAGALFVAVRFLPKLYLVIPGSILVGLTIGPFYTAIHSHICHLSTQYEAYHGGTYKEAVFKFTAIFNGWTSCTPLWLSVLHIVIFNIVGGDNSDDILSPGQDCGYSYLWDWSTSAAVANGLSPEFHSVQALLGSCLVCALGALLLTIVALADYKAPIHLKSSYAGDALKGEIHSNLEQLKNSNLMLMFPLFFGIGMLELFCYTLYGQAYISCNFGPDSQFYIILCMSAVAALTAIPCAFIYPRLSSTIKVALPAYGFTLSFLFVITFGGYMPYPMFFIMAALMGIANYVLTSQVTALVLIHCSSTVEASYSILQYGRISAYVLSFIFVRYQGDNSTIMVALFGALVISLMCHTILEIRLKLLQQEEKSGNDSSGAYVLIDKAPWIPEMDPTTVKQEQTKALLHRLPTKDELKQCNLTQ